MATEVRLRHTQTNSTRICGEVSVDERCHCSALAVSKSVYKLPRFPVTIITRLDAAIDNREKARNNMDTVFAKYTLNYRVEALTFFAVIERVLSAWPPMQRLHLAPILTEYPGPGKYY